MRLNEYHEVEKEFLDSGKSKNVPDLNKNISGGSNNPLSAEEINQINNLRSEIEQQTRQKQFLICEESNQIVTINGEQYTVEYVLKEEIYPAFGFSSGNRAVVRKDLPPRVKRFVREHELYHCIDQATWGGWLGKEIRANFVPGLKDPVGLLATVWATILDIDRIKLYISRFKHRR